MLCLLTFALLYASACQKIAGGGWGYFIVDRMLRRDRRGGPVLRVRRGGAGEHRGGAGVQIGKRKK